MLSSRSRRTLPLGALAALVLAGCSSSTSNSANPSLTTGLADTASTVVVNDVAALGDAVTSTGTSLNGLGASVSDGNVLAYTEGATSLSQPIEISAQQGFQNLRRGWDNCPLNSASKVTTQQSGGFRQTVWTFTNCTNTRPGTTESITRDGVITIVINPADSSRTHTFAARSGATAPVPFPSGLTPGFNVSWTRIKPGATTATTTAENRNGGRKITETKVNGVVTALNDSTNMTTVFTHADGTQSVHVRLWLTKFVPDAGQNISRDNDLPAGTWTYGGAAGSNTSTWTKNGVTRRFVVSTPTVNGKTGLHFNPQCNDAPQYDSGTLRTVSTTLDANGVATGASTQVDITFTACGTWTSTTTTPAP